MKKHTLRVSDNRMLPTILGTREEVTDARRTLHREGLHALYFTSNNILRQNKEMGRVCVARLEEQERCIQGFGGET
jgi:hypothetical protein